MDAKAFLEHVGILGMKWGRRSGGKSSGESESFKTRRLKSAIRSNEKDIKRIAEGKKGLEDYTTNRKSKGKYVSEKGQKRDLEILDGMSKGLKTYNTTLKKDLKNSQTRDKTNAPHKDSSTASKLQIKKTKHLSNDELKTVITRMQLEKQYKDLSKNEKSAGRKFVEGILKEAVKGKIMNAITKNG